VKAALHDFRERFAIRKVPRFGPFVLLVGATVERWWNDTDRGKLKCWEINLSQ